MRPRYSLPLFFLGIVSLSLVLFTTHGSSQSPSTADASPEIASSEVASEPLAQRPEPAAPTAEEIALAAQENEQTLAAIAPSQVIYLGELHTSEAAHAAQLDIIQARNSEADLAIGMEMFQRPFQPVLDSYLAGEITEAELIEQSEYETRWGYDWELYAPIVRYAKENQIPLIALNTPTEVTRQVAREGLNSLSGDALTYIPPVDEVDTSNKAYQESVAAVFGAHGGMGHSMSFENFFAAQVLWDETMADAIAKQLESDPDRQVIVLVGEGHIAYDYGIPDRVTRRIPGIEQASVRLQPANREIDPGFSDYAWKTP
ncbi:MAG: ChaN family lipoprotein [Cyanobacteria bacterium J06649_4]